MKAYITDVSINYEFLGLSSASLSFIGQSGNQEFSLEIKDFQPNFKNMLTSLGIDVYDSRNYDFDMEITIRATKKEPETQTITFK